MKKKSDRSSNRKKNLVNSLVSNAGTAAGGKRDSKKKNIALESSNLENLPKKENDNNKESFEPSQSFDEVFAHIINGPTTTPPTTTTTITPSPPLPPLKRMKLSTENGPSASSSTITAPTNFSQIEISKILNEKYENINSSSGGTAGKVKLMDIIKKEPNEPSSNTDKENLEEAQMNSTEVVVKKKKQKSKGGVYVGVSNRIDWLELQRKYGFENSSNFATFVIENMKILQRHMQFLLEVYAERHSEELEIFWRNGLPALYNNDGSLFTPSDLSSEQAKTIGEYIQTYLDSTQTRIFL